MPPYLRAEARVVALIWSSLGLVAPEGFVRYRYISKKECEDIMEAFHAEAAESGAGGQE